jgi:hypothetical protein
VSGFIQIFVLVQLFKKENPRNENPRKQHVYGTVGGLKNQISVILAAHWDS